LNQADILERLKNGDSAVFADVVNLWQDMVYNTALGIVQNEEDAEDITQEVFVQVYESIGGFREEAKLSTWLYRITISKSLDMEKKKRRQKHGGLLKRIFEPTEAEAPVSFDHPGVKLDNKENAAALFSAIRKLPEKQRLAFVLQKLESLSNEEIAQVLQMTVVAVDSLLARARTNLKSILQGYYENNFK
jgi:RNA polymerase sigma factor (sigma-70 family)